MKRIAHIFESGYWQEKNFREIEKWDLIKLFDPEYGEVLHGQEFLASSTPAKNPDCIYFIEVN